MLELAIAASFLLLGASFLLGLASPLFAAPRTIWKSLGLWGLGLGTGVAGILMSFEVLALQGEQRAAMRAAGQPVPVNDMPGFGQALLGMVGLMYFAALLVLILLIFVICLVSKANTRT